MSNMRIVFVVGLLLVSTAFGSVVPLVAEDNGSVGEESDVVVRYLTVNTEVWGPYAVTDIYSTLENTLDEPANHTFAFRIPRGGLISNFSIEINGTQYYADVLERAEAEKKYNESVANGETAGLLAARGDQTFAYSISFAAKETVRISLRYEHVLLRTLDWYRYEMNFTCQETPIPAESFKLEVRVNSISPILDYSTEGYDSDLKVVKPSGLNLLVTLNKEDFIPKTDLVISWKATHLPLDGRMMFGEYDGVGYFIHIFDPSPSNFANGSLPKDFVFVMDKSGSMSGPKFAQSKEALNVIYKSLRTCDGFSFVEFNSASHAYSNDLIPANKVSKDKILQYISNLTVGGGTNIHAGLIDGLEIMKGSERSVPVIVLLTDGHGNVGIYSSSPFRQSIKENNTVGASIFTIAIGQKADWKLCEDLALENNGRLAWITEDEDVEAEISDFVGSFSTPLLANLSFDYGPEVGDVHPREVRSHYLGSEVLVAGRFLPPLMQIPIFINATSSDGPLYVEDSFLVPVSSDNDFVPRFWAFNRIQSLLDLMKYNGTDNDTIDEIIDIAIDFHFVTDYTSLYVDIPEDVLARMDGTSGTGVSYSGSAPGGIGSGQGSGSSSGGWGPNDPTGTKDTDPDKDNLTNIQEFMYGTNPLNPDTDGDFLDDYTEVMLGTDPTDKDTDNDGLWDGQEISAGDGTRFFTDTDPLKADTDGDGLGDFADDGDKDRLSNGLEWRYDPLTGRPIDWLDPLDTDCDDDGVPDGHEIYGNPENNDQTSDPLNPDSDYDWLLDDIDPRTMEYDWLPFTRVMGQGSDQDPHFEIPMTGVPFVFKGHLEWNTTAYPVTSGSWAPLTDGTSMMVQLWLCQGDEEVPISDLVRTGTDGVFKISVTTGDNFTSGKAILIIKVTVGDEVVYRPCAWEGGVTLTG